MPAHQKSSEWAAPPTIRLATLTDRPQLDQLIAESARALSQGHYTDEQIEKALGTAWAVDTQLIEDGTYFVFAVSPTPETSSKADPEGDFGRPTRLVACGGWSYRGTLFGGDAEGSRDSQMLDPKADAARIRAFFVHPGWSRRGLGRQLLKACEEAAAAAGFSRYELVATGPGRELYQKFGYRQTEEIAYPLGHGETIAFYPMVKD